MRTPSLLWYVSAYIHQARPSVCWVVMAVMREEYETVDHYIHKLTEICREYIRRLEDLEVLGITEEEYE